MINDELERDRKEMNAESKLLLLGKNNFHFDFYYYYFKARENLERVQ